MKRMMSKYSGTVCPVCRQTIEAGTEIAYGKDPWAGPQRQGKAYHWPCWERRELEIAADDQDMRALAW